MAIQIRRLAARVFRCPYCHGLLRRGAGLVRCEVCATPHHAECFVEHTRCTTLGCRGVSALGPPPVRSRVELTLCALFLALVLNGCPIAVIPLIVYTDCGRGWREPDPSLCLYMRKEPPRLDVDGVRPPSITEPIAETSQPEAELLFPPVEIDWTMGCREIYPDGEDEIEERVLAAHRLRWRQRALETPAPSCND